MVTSSSSPKLGTIVGITYVVDRDGREVRRTRVGIDVGGTFTDLVALDGSEIVTAKVPSAPADQSVGVVAALDAAGLEPDAVELLAHGTTVATNTLLERNGARTALVTTEGFRDLIEIGRQNRPSLYDLTEDRPPSLVPRDLRFTVRERVGPAGVIKEMDEDSVARVVDALGRSAIEAVAVCLLFSFMHPEHEQRVGAAIRDALPDLHVSLSSEILREFREYERIATTTADAYLAPRVSAYLRSLASKLEQRGFPEPLVMQSSGGVMDIADASERAAACVLSGPAGGVVGAAHVAASMGYGDALTFDMGGTSTDVAPVVDGQVQTTTDSVVAGVPIRFPMVDVHSVSAGGGSIAWVDAGGALRVGPHSAGAEPGPAAYGKGGEDVTVTDADLCLGYLEDGAELGGEIVLRRDLAHRALQRLGRRLGMEVAEVARGVVRVANAEMARALRVISVERGLDPREYALVAFGGAGPMHACALAEDLGMTTVLVPKATGVLSALGLAMSDIRRDVVEPYFAAVEEIDDGDIAGRFRRLEAAAGQGLHGASFARHADLRYRGQSFELAVVAEDPGEIGSRFHDVHERHYGYRMGEEAVEIVNLRVTATVQGKKPEPSDPEREAQAVGARRASFDGARTDAEVFHRDDMGAGAQVFGPAIVEFKESTCVVRPGWAGAVDAAGTLVLERKR